MYTGLLAEHSREHFRWRIEKEKSFPGGRLHFWPCLVAILLYIIVNLDGINCSSSLHLILSTGCYVTMASERNREPGPRREASDNVQIEKGLVKSGSAAELLSPEEDRRILRKIDIWCESSPDPEKKHTV